MAVAATASPLSTVLSPLARSADRMPGLGRMLHAIRCHLGMDVAFVSQFLGPVRVFNHVDAAGYSPIQPGDSMPMESGYCQLVVDGRLPELIPDTSEVPVAWALPDTAAVPIGSHLSVPIRLSDGRIYGTFCCFGFQKDTGLNARDLGMMRAFAEIAAVQIEEQMEHDRKRHDGSQRVRFAIENDDPSIVYQPIYRLQDGRVSGLESLSRFSAPPLRPPDVWFSEAAAVDLGVELELCAIRKAVAGLHDLPAHVYVAVNSSPETILSGELDGALNGVDRHRIVLEVTEHAQVTDYPALCKALEGLRAEGVRLSIDDAGAGYSSMRHILLLRPDIIKLDISLTRNIDSDPTRYALAAALIEFARKTRCNVVAEGVETAAELEALRSLGAQTAQGFFLSRPLPLGQVTQLLC